ncbi:MAG: formylglycine-generating enzyme family protein [bacterium]|nr:formylglycine-generating enzyme family protein [bacterium]
MRFRFSPGSEKPRPRESHDAQLRPLWVGEAEVTRRQWQRVVGNRPGHHLACGDDCPVEMIDWYEALAFANALSEQSGFPKCYNLIGCKGELGKEGPYRDTLGMACEAAELVGDNCSGYRLPTEAEWEHFARAGTTTDIYSGDLVIEPPLIACGGPALDAIAWYTCTSGQSTHPAGSKASNSWNIFDTIGNVSEWIWDC